MFISWTNSSCFKRVIFYNFDHIIYTFLNFLTLRNILWKFKVLSKIKTYVETDFYFLQIIKFVRKLVMKELPFILCKGTLKNMITPFKLIEIFIFSKKQLIVNQLIKIWYKSHCYVFRKSAWKRILLSKIFKFF